MVTLQSVRAQGRRCRIEEERGGFTRRRAATKTNHPLGSRESHVDSATIRLLATWRSLDVTDDPAQVRTADAEIAAFKRAMNENRSLAGKSILFP
jgi:hypothetical protein